jgi:hypothetical protein
MSGDDLGGMANGHGLHGLHGGPGPYARVHPRAMPAVGWSFEERERFRLERERHDLHAVRDRDTPTEEVGQSTSCWLESKFVYSIFKLLQYHYNIITILLEPLKFLLLNRPLNRTSWHLRLPLVWCATATHSQSPSMTCTCERLYPKRDPLRMA